jgi:hypothetical protein
MTGKDALAMVGVVWIVLLAMGIGLGALAFRAAGRASR